VVSSIPVLQAASVAPTVVNSNIDRVLARSLATQFGAFSVTNDLKTDAEVQALLEKQSE